MNLSVKAVKFHDDMSQETACFSAKLCLDGKEVGQVSNDGNGGPHRYAWKDNALGCRIDDWAQTQPTEFEFEKLDQVVDRLLARVEATQRLAKFMKEGTVFLLNGDNPANWRLIKRPFNQETANRLRQQYGDTLRLIANENPDRAVDVTLESPNI